MGRRDQNLTHFETTILVLSNSCIDNMHLLVISGVKEMKVYRVGKRRKSETKKLEEVEGQKDRGWEGNHGSGPLVQGHMEEHR